MEAGKKPNQTDFVYDALKKKCCYSVGGGNREPYLEEKMAK